jgi:hypothetical protein
MTRQMAETAAEEIKGTGSFVGINVVLSIRLDPGASWCFHLKLIHKVD